METKRILVVEDEGVVAWEIKTELGALGYAVDSVGSGEAAVDSVARTAPDLILMDIRLQGKIDGTETAARIREKHDIPVIFLTAHTDENTVEKALLSRPYNYIVKPFTINELRIAIDIALYKHHMEREKDQLITELQTALGAVKQLSGMLCICSYCKKIRSEKDSWVQMETFITELSGTVFSHGCCPACAEKVQKEYDELIAQSEEKR